MILTRHLFRSEIGLGVSVDPLGLGADQFGPSIRGFNTGVHLKDTNPKDAHPKDTHLKDTHLKDTIF